MIPKGVMLVVAGTAAALALGGCREAEQNRVLSYDKGVYLGQADDPVTAQSQDERRQRMRRYWSAGAYAALGGGAPSSVRPPEGAAPGRARVLMQGEK